MSNRWPGGVVRSTPVIPTGPYETSSASGVWTIADVGYWVKQGLWPTAGNDQYFNYNTLLMSTTAINGAQNNTFLDSSTNNFTITRNGNTTQGSFTPYWSYWSNYFNGSGDYLGIASNAAFGMGTGDFTLECWVNPSAYTGTGNVLIDMRSGTEPSVRPDLEYNSSGVLNYRVNGSTVISGGTLVIGTWSHVALARSGTTTKLFLNGTQVGSSYTDTNNYGSSAACRIGADDDGSPNAYVNGYMSNVRVVKGTAVYTANFTPPTAPLTAISGTSLLTCQSSRFVDNSGNALAITATGSPKVNNFSPFNPTAPYSTATNGGSGYFDGSGDYLTSAASSAYAMGTGDFTIEGWFFTTASADQGLWDNRASSSSASGIGCRLVTSTNTLRVILNNTALFTTSTAVTLNQWNHIAVVRASGTVTAYLNGTAMTGGSASGTTNITDTNMWIGKLQDAGFFYNGYVSNFRAVKGTAVYTANFTPPATPLTAITNTSLLLNFTNAGIYDQTITNDMETVGDAKVSTVQSKYGGSSVYFDGSGDDLFMASSPSLNFGTANWTIECWVYVSTRTTNYPLIFGNNRGSWTTDAVALTASNADSGSFNDKFVFAWNNGGFTSPSAGNSQLLVANVANSTGTWYHFAVVRDSSTSIKMFRDGTQVANATISSAASFNWGYNGTLIGGGNWDGAQGYFNGYIDELRVTNGIARYTSSFTPPSGPFGTF